MIHSGSSGPSWPAPAASHGLADHHTYGYDRGSNRTYKHNAVVANKDEAHHGNDANSSRIFRQNEVAHAAAKLKVERHISDEGDKLNSFWSRTMYPWSVL